MTSNFLFTLKKFLFAVFRQGEVRRIRGDCSEYAYFLFQICCCLFTCVQGEMKDIGSCIIWLCMAEFLLPVSTSVAVSDHTGISIFLAHHRPEVLISVLKKFQQITRAHRK